MSGALPGLRCTSTARGKAFNLARSRVTRTRELGVLAMVLEAAPEHVEHSGFIDCKLKAIRCRTLGCVRTTNVRSLKQKKRLGEWAESSES